MGSAGFLAAALPFERARLSDLLVADYLRAIVGGSLRPGDELPSEPEIAARYGCSKVVVRESVRALATLGFISVQQGRRSTVRRETSWDVNSPVVQAAYRMEGKGDDLLESLFEARLVLEPAIVGFGAIRATADQRAELLETIERMISAVDGDDAGAYRSADLRYHELLGEMCANPSLRATLRDLMHYVNTLVPVERGLPDESRALALGHGALARAIADRDPDTASGLARQSLVVTRGVLLERLAAAGG